jgi:hypothetical protein
LSILRPTTHNSDDDLQEIERGTWIRSLPGASLCECMRDVIIENKYLFKLFNNSVNDYKRDDYTARELPGMSIYQKFPVMPRFGRITADVYLDIYLPIKIARTNTMTVFNGVYQAVVLMLQQPNFFSKLVLKMCPLPEVVAQNYEDTLNYQQGNGHMLVQFAEKCSGELPTVINLKDVGDTWKMTIRCPYAIEMMNYYEMLEDIGISADVDVNLIIYNELSTFTVETSIEEQM